MKKRNLSLRVSLDGIICALALALSFFESLIPAISFLPPGAKLGLSNIAVMFAVLSIGKTDGFLIVLIKSAFVLLTKGPASFFMSFSGGILSFLALILIIYLSKKLNREFSYIGISVICAVMHNAGQTCAASIYMKTNLITSYLPLLTIAGIGAGVITGIVLKAVMPSLLKISGKLKDRG